MIRTILYQPGGELVEGDEALIDRWRTLDGAFLWVDLHEVASRTEHQLLSEFGVHELAIKDAQRVRHPPKLEIFDNFAFFLLRGLDATSTSINLKTIQLSLFVGERVLITRHDGQSVSVDLVWNQVLDHPALFEDGPARLATNIAKTSAKRYLPILLGLENRLGELEDELLEKPNDEQLAELVSYKTRLRKIRRTFAYHERLFSRFRSGEVAFFSEDLGHEMRDVYDSVERLRSLSDMYYEVTGDLIEGYISIASHRLNQIMKVLTIVTTIFVPLGFLAGIYGMNFEYIPELKYQNGYFVLLSIMGTVVVVLLGIFRWKKWL